MLGSYSEAEKSAHPSKLSTLLVGAASISGWVVLSLHPVPRCHGLCLPGIDPSRDRVLREGLKKKMVMSIGETEGQWLILKNRF